MLCLLVPDEDDERHGDGGHGQGGLHTDHAPELYSRQTKSESFEALYYYKYYYQK